MLNKKTVDDLTGLQGKKVLVRCDFNVPLKEGVIQNYNRIDGAIPTIKKLLDQGAKVILCSHLGKPKGEPLPELSLAPVAPALSERLGVEVKFVDDPKVTGPETQKVAAELRMAKFYYFRIPVTESKRQSTEKMRMRKAMRKNWLISATASL